MISGRRAVPTLTSQALPVARSPRPCGGRPRLYAQQDGRVEGRASVVLRDPVQRAPLEGPSGSSPGPLPQAEEGSGRGRRCCAAVPESRMPRRPKARRTPSRRPGSTATIAGLSSSIVCLYCPEKSPARSLEIGIRVGRDRSLEEGVRPQNKPRRGSTAGNVEEAVSGGMVDTDGARAGSSSACRADHQEYRREVVEGQERDDRGRAGRPGASSSDVSEGTSASPWRPEARPSPR